MRCAGQSFAEFDTYQRWPAQVPYELGALHWTRSGPLYTLTFHDLAWLSYMDA